MVDILYQSEAARGSHDAYLGAGRLYPRISLSESYKKRQRPSSTTNQRCSMRYICHAPVWENSILPPDHAKAVESIDN